MSTHVFDNVRVEAVLDLRSSGRVSSTGIDLALAPGTNVLRQTFGALEKATFVTTKSMAAASGAQAVTLFSLVLPSNSAGGLKVHLSTIDAAGASVRFEEYVGQARHLSAGDAVDLYQLAVVPTNTANAATSNIDATALTAGSTTAAGGALTVPVVFSYAASGTAGISVRYFVEWFGTAGVGFTAG